MADRADPPPGDVEELTSLHVRGALGGDAASVDWIVARFSPLLLAQADYRLGPRLRRLHDPRDLVNDVWLRALPRLGAVSPRDGRFTPVVLRFLTTTLLRRIADLFEKHVLGKPAAATADGGRAGDTLDRLPAEATGVVTRVVAREAAGALAAAIGELAPREREIVVLRGIEQRSTRAVALELGIGEEAVSSRDRRALGRLRAGIAGSVLEQLAGE